MAGRQRTIANIINHVAASKKPDFGCWRIGITNDIEVLSREWHRPEGFISWCADSWEDARVIETFFVYVKGMVGDITGELDSEDAACIYLIPLS
jgi:hypothetical protein